MIWAALPLAWRLGIVAVSLLAVVGTVSGIVLKIKHDAVVAERARVEKEKQNAIDQARKAVDLLRSRCRDNPTDCIPTDWFRD